MPLFLSREFLLVTQILCTGYMTGLIWFVQVVHYPLFRSVAELGPFSDYSNRHSQLTTLVVGPVMTLELALSVAFALSGFKWGSALLMLTLVIWGTTFFVSVPCHNQLALGFDLFAWEKLVSTNWIRTFAWSARSGLLGYLLFEFLVELNKQLTRIN